jgi:sugar lactone lactonase YvrE
VRAEVVVDGIEFGEGPVWCAADQTLVVTSVTGGCLWRVWPEQGRRELIADTDGGANGATPASDGGFLVTNNGGVDLSETGVIEHPPPPRVAPAGLQRVSPDGTVTYLARGALNAPNDLCVSATGTVYFTDPGHFPPPEGRVVGRVMAYEVDGDLRTHAEGLWYCNGIAFDPDGQLVVVEQAGLLRLNSDGTREWVIERLGPGAGDGFCVDADGRYFVASTTEHGVRVIEDGKEVDFLEIEGKGITTNCCFGGADGRLLFATDAVPGRVVVWEGLTAPGLPIHAWPVPADP